MFVLAGPAVAGAPQNGVQDAAAGVVAGAAAAGAQTPPLRAPAVQQDTLTAADEAPGRNVRMSLSENFLADRLPFDVPFNLTGAVETTVRRLDLLIYRVNSNADLAALTTELRNTSNCVVAAPPVAPRSRVRPRVSLASRSTGVPATDGKFSLLVNALEPQYYYAICLVGITPVPPAEIEADVRRVVRDNLPRSIAAGDITLSMLRSIRAAMSERIRQIGAGRTLPAQIPPGNLFDLGVAEPPLFAQIARGFGQSYGNMELQRGQFTDTLQTLAMDLAAARLASVPITTELAQALSSNRLVLPTREQAITDSKPFDRGSTGIDTAKGLLAVAIRTAGLPAAQQQLLQTMSDDLIELDDVINRYESDYNIVRNVTSDLLRVVQLEAREVTVTLGSSVLGADLVRSTYVSLDAGIAYSWRLENMVFYAGTNIYFRPINKAAPLRYAGKFSQRFALTVGLTTTVDDNTRRAGDLRPTEEKDTSNSLLLGAGIRVTPSIRVGAGVLVFKESDPNPLIQQTSVTATPCVTFTADVDVAQLFRSLF